MASARQAQLAEQRASSLYGSGKIRILSPGSTAVSSIAKQNAIAETSAMVDKYNAGLISNAEMLAFLERQSTNKYLTPDQRTSLQDQIRNFDTLVMKDSLETRYSSAPPNSLEQVQAAQALSSFYATRASTMQAGTPAQYQALQNKATWDTRIANISDAMKTEQRRNLRYVEAQKVNQIPSGTSDNALAKAEMWGKLAEQAAADGDEVDYNKYLSYYQSEMTRAQQLYDTEVAKQGKELRGDRIDDLNQAKVLYRDGKITFQQYYDILQGVEDYAVANNDYSLQLKIRSDLDAMQKVEKKGGYSLQGYGGSLSAVIGRGGSGGSGGEITGYDQEQYNYTAQMRDAYQKLLDEEIDHKTYLTVISGLITDREQILKQQIEEYEAIAEVNSNADVRINGNKTDVSNALNTLYKEYKDIEAQKRVIESGSAVLMQIEAKATGVGADSIPQVILVNGQNLLKSPGDWATDDQGVVHMKKSEEVLIEEAMKDPAFAALFNDKNGKFDNLLFASAVNAGRIMDQNGNWVELRKDNDTNQVYLKTGRPYITVGFDPDNNELREYTDTGKTIQSYTTRMAQYRNQKNIEAADQSERVYDDATRLRQSAYQVPDLVLKPPSLVDQLKGGAIQVGKDIQQGYQNVVAPKIQQAPQVAKSAVDTVGKVVAPLIPQVQKVQKTITQSPYSALKETLSPTPVNYGPTTSSRPELPITMNMGDQKYVRQFEPETSSFSFQKVPSGGYSVPKPVPAPQPTTLQKIGTAITKPFDFLKSLF